MKDANAAEQSEAGVSSGRRNDPRNPIEPERTERWGTRGRHRATRNEGTPPASRSASSVRTTAARSPHNHCPDRDVTRWRRLRSQAGVSPPECPTTSLLSRYNSGRRLPTFVERPDAPPRRDGVERGIRKDGPYPILCRSYFQRCPM